MTTPDDLLPQPSIFDLLEPLADRLVANGGPDIRGYYARGTGGLDIEAIIDKLVPDLLPQEGLVERTKRYIAEYEGALNWGGPTMYPDRPMIADIKALLSNSIEIERLKAENAKLKRDREEMFFADNALAEQIEAALGTPGGKNGGFPARIEGLKKRVEKLEAALKPFAADGFPSGHYLTDCIRNARSALQDKGPRP